MAPAPAAPSTRSDPATPPDVEQAEHKDTKERILDIALDLFIEKGYDKTSLREIAAELGFSKAALYYHFASKGDILLALHLRLHELGRDALGRMGSQVTSPELWASLLDQFIEQMLTHRKLFVLHERNRAALEELHSERHDGDHTDLEQQFRQLLNDPGVPLRDRVRMACSLGAVMGGLLFSTDALADASTSELGDLVREAARDLLGTGPRAAPADRPAG